MHTEEISTCFCTPDIERCRDFYIRHFAAKVTFDCGWYVNLSLGGDGPTVHFMKPQGDMPTYAGQGVTLNFRVEDVDAEHARLNAEGLTVVMPLADHPWGDRGFAVLDPLGTILYLYTETEPAEEFKAFFKG